MPFYLFTKHFSVRMNKCDICFIQTISSRITEGKSNMKCFYLEQVLPISAAKNPQYIIFIGQKFVQVFKRRMILVHRQKCDDVSTDSKRRSVNNDTSNHFFFKICAEFHEASIVCSKDHLWIFAQLS